VDRMSRISTGISFSMTLSSAWLNPTGRLGIYAVAGREATVQSRHLAHAIGALA
jgi:hypothetical protein